MILQSKMRQSYYQNRPYCLTKKTPINIHMYVHSLLRLLALMFISFSINCSMHLSISSLEEVKLSENITSPNPDQTPPQIVAPLACDPAITNNYGGGDGSISKPFTICSLAHWSFFGDDSLSWGQNFKLYSDLDFTGITALDFKPIGNGTTAFTGNFDGNGFKIANLTLIEAAKTLAIFKKTDSNVRISNLKIENITFTTDTRMAGIVLDHGNNGTLNFDNITITNLTLSPLGGGIHNVGGLVGNTNSSLDISNITINDIHFTNPGAGPCNSWGGLAGFVTGTSNVNNVSGNSIRIDGNSFSSTAAVVGIAMSVANFSNINLTGLNIRAGLSRGSGLISNTNSDVNINQVHLAGSVYGSTQAGGLICESSNSGAAANINIVESSFDGPISAGFVSGGLISLVFGNNISITRSYYKGNMMDVWNGSGAGLIAQSQGATTTVTISDSYVVSNMSNAHATNWLVAGLIALAQGNVTLTRSYYSGTLSGTAPRACIADNVSSASFVATDTYYNSTVCTANANKTGVITGVTGLNTAALQTGTAFTNWLPTVWKFTATQNPRLFWEPDPVN